MSLYFNASVLPEPRGEYVMWCDGMGSGRALLTSPPQAANFIFKLHKAFSETVAQAADAAIYPVVDGVYITTPSRQTLLGIARDSFKLLAEEFLEQGESHKRFLVRGGIAYGSSIHGKDVPDEAFIHGLGTQYEADNRAAFEGSTLSQTRDGLILHTGLAAAYTVERNAAPFGIAVDDSAISAPMLVNPADPGFSTRSWRWWMAPGPNLDALINRLAPAVINHIQEAKSRSRELAYPQEAGDRHLASCTEFFQDYLP